MTVDFELWTRETGDLAPLLPRAGEWDASDFFESRIVIFFGSYATGIGFGVTMLKIGAVALRSGALLPR